MSDYLIVGGGLSGLLVARCLSSRGLDFLVLERADTLGGRWETGHHRVLNSNTIEVLRSVIDPAKWDFIDENASERRKGEFAEIALDNLSETVKFYATSKFYSVTKHSPHFRGIGEENEKKNYLMRKNVKKIDLTAKTLECADGSSYPFQKLIWTAPFEFLTKALSENSGTKVTGLSKKLDVSDRGINLTWQLKRPVLERRNSVFTQFRYKDEKFRAIGVETPLENGAAKLDWLTFIDSELADDREELAKFVRAFKREILKEFEALNGKITLETIVFLENTSGEKPLELSSLEIEPDIFVLNSQVRGKGIDTELRNTDLVASNFCHIESLLVGDPAVDTAEATVNEVNSNN